MPGVRGTIPGGGTPPQEDYPVRVGGSEGSGQGTVRSMNVDAAGDVQADVKSIVPGTGATALGKAEDAAHVSGDTGVMALGVRRDTAAASSGTDGDYEPLSTDNAGRLRIAAAIANSGVDIGDVDILSVVPGTGATNLGKAEDAAHASADVGVLALGVRNDANATRTDTDGDYSSVSVDLAGNRRTVGNVDHDAVDAGSPVKIGGKGVTAVPAAVSASADRTDAYFDDRGFQHIKVGGVTVAVNGTNTRPADTVTYTAGDAVTDSTTAPTVITFTNCARYNGASGMVVGALLVDSASVATKGVFELWLFDTTFTPDNDNTVFTPTDGELATLVGVIQFSSPFVGDATVGAGGNAVYPSGGLNLPFVTGGASRNLFGGLVVRNGYIPVSAEAFTVRLFIAQD